MMQTTTLRLDGAGVGTEANRLVMQMRAGGERQGEVPVESLHQLPT